MKKQKVKSEISLSKLIFAVVLLIIAVICQYYSGIYTNNVKTAEVPDLILSLIGPYDLGFIYIWLYLPVIALFVAYPLIFKRSKFTFTLNMLALFIIVRAGFICLTHLAVPSDAIYPVFPWIFQNLGFNNDLFFSGHTGLPFLGFLIFRYNKKLSYFMLAASIILGISVLLMHAHYSIDVFAAYFITYGIYKIGNRIFPE